MIGFVWSYVNKWGCVVLILNIKIFLRCIINNVLYNMNVREKFERFGGY